MKTFFCGIGQVLLGLCKSLQDSNGDEFNYRVVCRAQIASELGKHLDIEIRRYDYSLRNRIVRHLTGSSVAMVADQGDVSLWHMIDGSSHICPAHAELPVTATYHDLVYLEKAKNFAAKKMVGRRLQKTAERLVAACFVSWHTKRLVEKNIRFPNLVTAEVIPNAAVVHNGRARRPLAMSLRNGGNFLLIIAHALRHKNVRLLPKLLPHLPADWLLVVAGKSGRQDADIKAAACSCGVSDRVVFTGIVSDAEKHWLLENCQALLFPSSSEGFGLPPLEAMLYGKPVFASDIPAVREVCADSADYFGLDEFNQPAALAARILERLGSRSKQQEAAARARAGRFSWEASAAQYIRLWQRAISGRKQASPRI